MTKKTKAQLVEELVEVQGQLTGVTADYEQAIRIAESLSTREVLGEKGWRMMGVADDPSALDAGVVFEIIQRSRMAALLSPVIRAGLQALKLFTYAQGVTITAEDEQIDAVVQAFVGDKGNKRSYFGFKRRMDNVWDTHRDGSLYLRLFRTQGGVKVRRMDALTMSPKPFCNPQDKEDIWFYYDDRCAFPDVLFCPPERGATDGVTRASAEKELAGKIGTRAIDWDTPMVRVVVNENNNMGLPSYLASMNWAKEYERFLENRLTLYAAFAVFALIAKNQARRLGATRATLGTAGQSPVKGATGVMNPEASIEALKTKDATTSPSEGLQFLEMVMMDFGFPPHIWGKEEPGGMGEAGRNKAFLLRIQAEQTAWKETDMELLDYVLLQEASEGGQLSSLGAVEQDGTGKRVVWNDGVDSTIHIVYPPITDEDTSAMIRDIIAIATLDGKAPTGHITPDLFMRMLERYIKIDDMSSVIDDIADRLGNEWPMGESALDEFVESLKEVANASPAS